MGGYTNKLKFNLSKTEYIAIGRKQDRCAVPILDIAVQLVKPVPSIRDIRALLDEAMVMSSHIAKACQFGYLSPEEYLRK